MIKRIRDKNDSAIVEHHAKWVAEGGDIGRTPIAGEGSRSIPGNSARHTPGFVIYTQ